MPIITKDKERVYKICLHELGHYLIAQECGFKSNFICVNFSPNTGHQGGADLDLPKEGVSNLKDIVDYLEKRIIILYAGVIAESTDVSGACDSNYALNQWENEGGVHDHAKIRELVHVIRNIKYPTSIDVTAVNQELKVIDDDLISRAENLVSSKNALLHYLAGQLSEEVFTYHVDYKFDAQTITEMINAFKSK